MARHGMDISSASQNQLKTFSHSASEFTRKCGWPAPNISVFDSLTHRMGQSAIQSPQLRRRFDELAASAEDWTKEQHT
jgi:hypothetical protein